MEETGQLVISIKLITWENLRKSVNIGMLYIIQAFEPKIDGFCYQCFHIHHPQEPRPQECVI